MNHQLAFSTFLKLLQLEEKKARSTFRGFQRKGGYNYWRPIQQNSGAVIRKELPVDDISAKVAKMAQGHQRKYNEQALLKIARWFERRRALWRNPQPRKVVPIGNAGLAVRIEPEIGFVQGGRHFLMHVWATMTPVLSDDVISAGLYFLKENGEWETTDAFEWLIYDTVKDRVAGEIDMLAGSERWLKNKIAKLDELWRQESNKERAPSNPDQPHAPFTPL